jgi:hypothetical protein
MQNARVIAPGSRTSVSGLGDSDIADMEQLRRRQTILGEILSNAVAIVARTEDEPDDEELPPAS